MSRNKQKIKRQVTPVSANAPLKTHKGLVVHPLAFLKLQALGRSVPTEIGAYAVTHEDNPLYIVDFVVPEQICTKATFEFIPDKLPETYLQMAEREIPVERYNRIIAHTHPSTSATPSGVDWDSFWESSRLSLGMWGMLILGTEGETTFHLGVPVGPAILEISMKVIHDDRELPISDFEGELSAATLLADISKVHTPPVQTYRRSENRQIVVSPQSPQGDGGSLLFPDGTSDGTGGGPAQLQSVINATPDYVAFTRIPIHRATRYQLFQLLGNQPRRHIANIYGPETPVGFNAYVHRMSRDLIAAAEDCLAFTIDASTATMPDDTHIFRLARAYLALDFRDQGSVDKTIFDDALTRFQSGDDCVDHIMTALAKIGTLLQEA